jgi:hypothetical protein
MMKSASSLMIPMLLLFSFVLFLPLVERCDAFTPTPAPEIVWKNYSNTLYGFSIRYPSSLDAKPLRDYKNGYVENEIGLPTGNHKVEILIFTISDKSVKSWNEALRTSQDVGDSEPFPYSLKDLKSAVQLPEGSDCLDSQNGKVVSMNGLKAIRLLVGMGGNSDTGEKIRYFIYRGHDRWIEVNVILADVDDLGYLTGSKKMPPDLREGMDAADSVLGTMRFFKN